MVPVISGEVHLQWVSSNSVSPMSGPHQSQARTYLGKLDVLLDELKEQRRTEPHTEWLAETPLESLHIGELVSRGLSAVSGSLGVALGFARRRLLRQIPHGAGIRPDGR